MNAPGDPIPALGRHSARLRAFRELSSAAARRRLGACVFEGPHLFERLLGELTAGRPLAYRPRFFIMSESYRERFLSLGLADACARIGLDGALVGERVMQTLSDCETPPGILVEVELDPALRDLRGRIGALMRRPALRLVMTGGVSDPGNLGALARTAAALGADAFVSHGGADPFGPKTLRATAGAFLGVPYGEIAEPVRLLDELRGNGVTIIASVARGGRDPAGLRTPRRWVLLLGSEAHGLPDEWGRRADLALTIPLRRGVESLNVAVAGGLLLYRLSGPAPGSGRARTRPGRSRS